MEWVQLIGNTLHGSIYLWWWASHQSLAHKGLRILRFLLCLGTRTLNQKMHGKTEWCGSTDSSEYRTLDRIDGEPLEMEWNIFPGFTTWELCTEVQELLSKLSLTPGKFIERIIFMSMFNDISWGSKDNKKECESNAQLVSLYAKRFGAGQWSFLGPGSERSWFREKVVFHQWRHSTRRMGQNCRANDVDICRKRTPSLPIRVPYPEECLRAKVVGNWQYTIAQTRERLKLFFRTRTSVHQLSLTEQSQKCVKNVNPFMIEQGDLLWKDNLTYWSCQVWWRHTYLWPMTRHQMCVAPSWRGDLGANPGGWLPGSPAPTMLVAEPPAQCGILMLGMMAIQTVLSLHAPRRTVNTATDPDDASHTAPIFEGYLKILTERGNLFTTTAEREIVRDVKEKLCYIALGYALPHAILQLDLDCRVLAEYLMKILTEREHSSTTTAEREIARDVKDKLCYVAFGYDTELKSTAESSEKNQTYMLSDRNVGTVGAERFRCLSVLPNASGILDTSSSSNMKCDVYIHRDPYAIVVPSGDTTMFQGTGAWRRNWRCCLFPRRRSRKLLHQTEIPRHRFKGLFLSSLSTLLQIWISRASTMDLFQPSPIRSAL